MLTIEIETGNAAFADGNEAAELARILREAAQRIEHGCTGFPLRDNNGNRVGYCEYEPSEYDDDDSEEEED